MTKEQIEKGADLLDAIERVKAEITMLHEITPRGSVFVFLGQYGNVHADEDLLKRLIAVCIANNENKLSKLEEELKNL